MSQVVAGLVGVLVGAILTSWLTYALAIRREFWIRRLNSYQDFCHHMADVIGILESRSRIPEDSLWRGIEAARKAAFDAAFFDPANPARTERMQGMTTKLLSVVDHSDEQAELAALSKSVDEIRDAYYHEERALGFPLTGLYSRFIKRKVGGSGGVLR